MEKICDKFYGIIYLVLIALTVLTVLSAQMDFARSLTILIALSIALIKSSLIALYYMHLRTEKPLIYFIVLIGIVTVFILAVGIFPDIAIGL
ncbi:MAG: cytochrome C oxidase subunit IV family protein [Elusimicrobia bacterium]|nr:cytochrome C oxidase subunit IV family protein [Elusimicrobiota bacterium]